MIQDRRVVVNIKVHFTIYLESSGHWVARRSVILTPTQKNTNPSEQENSWFMASPSLSLRYSTFGCVKIAICRVWNLCKKRIQIKCLWSPWKNSLVLCYVSEFVLEATITAGNCFCFVADFVQNRGELIGHFKGMISSLFQVSAHGQNHLRSSLKKVLVIFPLFFCQEYENNHDKLEKGTI